MKPGASLPRFQSWLGVLALGLGFCLPTGAVARQLSLPACLASPGMLVQVPVLLDDAAGLASLGLKINFSPHLLEFQSAQPGALGEAFELNQSMADGVIMLLFTRETDLVSGSGRLAVLTFRVNPGAAPDAFSDLAVADFQVGNDSGVATLDADTPPMTFNGRVTIDTSGFLDADADNLPDAWETSHGLSMLDSDTLLDPDGDGVTNLMEYALGMDPQLAGQNALTPALGTLQIANSTYLTLSFRRLIAPPPGLTYQVEESSDLIDWSPLDSALYQVAPPIDLGNGLESVTVQGTIPLSGPEADPRAFMQMRVNAPAP